mgnify:FL=1
MPLLVSVGLLPLAAVTLLLLIAWEVFEKWVLGVPETPHNQTADVLFGMAGFYAAYYFVEMVTEPTAWSAVVVTAAGNMGLCFWGWRTSVRAEAVKTKLREDYEYERERLRLMRTSIREDLADAKRLSGEWKKRRKERRAEKRARRQTARHPNSK